MTWAGAGGPGGAGRGMGSSGWGAAVRVVRPQDSRLGIPGTQGGQIPCRMQALQPLLETQDIQTPQALLPQGPIPQLPGWRSLVAPLPQADWNNFLANPSLSPPYPWYP